MLLRNARKSIYRLQDSSAPGARAVLHVALGGYRLVDTLVLRRARRMDLASEKIVSDQRTFLCVVVPKAGSRTLVAGLSAAAREGFDLRISERSIEAFVDGYDDYYTFAIVRDPWARCYSCYKQKFERCTPITAARTFHGRSGLDPSMSFDEFVRWLGTDAGRDEVADRHWLSQHRILGLDRGVAYDRIGKLERFREDVAEVAREIGIDPAVFRHELRTSDPDEYLRHYTPELVELVGRRYARDVEAFGYQPPTLP
jgi:hypothetical protein